jgi:hypothetical protein
VNTGDLRNGFLMFWKLAPPNVIPGLVSPSRMRTKAAYDQHLSQNSGLILITGASGL